jgi:hypothetical protein
MVLIEGMKRLPLGHLQRLNASWTQIVSDFVHLGQATDNKSDVSSPLTIWVGDSHSGPTILVGDAIFFFFPYFRKCVQEYE